MWPPSPIGSACMLSYCAPLEEKSPRTRSTVLGGHRDHPRRLVERADAGLAVLGAGVAGGEHDGGALVGDRLGGDVDRVLRVVLAEAVAPRVVDDVDAEHLRLAQHVVVGRDDGGGGDHRADGEAGELRVGRDAEVVRAGGAVGRDDAGDVGAVAAADVGVVVGTLVDGHDEGVGLVGLLVGVLGADQRDVVLDVVGEVGVGRRRSRSRRRRR